MSLRSGLSCLVIAVAACGGDTISATAPQPPSIGEVTAVANPNSAVSFNVAVTTDRADSIRIRYESAVDSSDTTPFYRVVAHVPTAIAVVGLRPSTTYSLVAEAIGPIKASGLAHASIGVP